MGCEGKTQGTVNDESNSLNARGDIAERMRSTEVHVQATENEVVSVEAKV